MTSATPSRTTQEIFTTSPSIPKILRYVEWISLGIPTLRMLFPILYQPLGYEVSRGDYFVFGVFGLFIILSLYFPLNRPLWQRRVYIWVEISCLLATRLFSNWGLDLILWFVFVKCFFLLSQRETIYTVIASGLAWQVVFAQYVTRQLSQPIEQHYEQIQTVYSVPTPIQVANAVLNSTSVFIAANLLIILLCLTVISERKSRQREAALAQEVEILAADLERTRIARDIHDSLGHSLTTLDVYLELAQTLHSKNPTRALEALNTAKSLSNQSLQDVRRAVSTLREENFDLNIALSRLIEQINCNQTFTINLQISLPKLPLQMSQQLYLIVKEGLTNIQKHSQASFIQLKAISTASDLMLELSDNGVGFNLEIPSSGFGLRGIQERVQLLKGKIEIRSHLGEGTSIQIIIPR